MDVNIELDEVAGEIVFKYESEIIGNLKDALDGLAETNLEKTKQTELVVLENEGVKHGRG